MTTMHKYKITKLMTRDNRFMAKCKVCSRRPRTNRNRYWVTSTSTERGFIFTHGTFDTQRCMMKYLLEHMGD